MKEKRAKLREKKKKENDKLAQKQERLRLLDEQNEQQRKNIIKKIKKMEKKKLELDKKKDEFYQQIKQGMDMKMKGTKDNKISLTKEKEAKRDEVLEYEFYVFNRIKEKEANNISKRAQSQSRTIQNQKDDQNKMRQFKRIIYSLQDDSVANKNDKQKRLMYKEKVRKDMEEKKKRKKKNWNKLVFFDCNIITKNNLE